jgi:hypothetical protein
LEIKGEKERAYLLFLLTRLLRSNTIRMVMNVKTIVFLALVITPSILPSCNGGNGKQPTLTYFAVF